MEERHPITASRGQFVPQVFTLHLPPHEETDSYAPQGEEELGREEIKEVKEAHAEERHILPRSETQRAAHA